MSAPKPFASLSPTLLARKGAARPAMRPQLHPMQHFHEATARQLEEDLGWNDMGDDAMDFGEAGLDEMGHEAAGEQPDDFDLSGAEELLAAKRAQPEPATRSTPAPVARLEARPRAEACPRSEIDPGMEVCLEAEVVALNGTEALQPELPAVVRQQAQIARDFGKGSRTRKARITAEQTVDAKSAVKPAARKARQCALPKGSRAAFTLRLDAERHLKLRLACTLENRSAQQIVTEALDRLIAQMPDIEALASQVKKRN